MMNSDSPKILIAGSAPPRSKPSNYPEPFASKMAGRLKRPLGDPFGINLTELLPNAESALLHKHSKQEEFIYILAGHPTLILEDDEFLLSPGTCFGFTPSMSAHKLVNRSEETVLYLEIGDRIPDDQVTYPRDDIEAKQSPQGAWLFYHKNGEPY